MKTLHDFLQEKAREQDKIEQKKRRDEWTTAVRLLIETLRNWLTEADPEGLLDIETPMVNRREEGLGAYKAMSLEVGLGGDFVNIVPVGRNVVRFVLKGSDIGLRAQGRVDITNGSRKYMLFRTIEDGHDRWYVVDDEKYEASPLDKERFESVMKDRLS
jgi:hypothetical protein